MALSEFEQQVQRMKRFNLLFAAGIGLFLTVMFAGILAYTIHLTQANKHTLHTISSDMQRQQIVHKATTDENLRLNNAQVCILSIPATERTQQNIDDCLIRHNASYER